MEKFRRLLVSVLVIGLPCAYGVHLYRNWQRIQSNLKMREAVVVRPAVGKDSVSEVGYIYGMRRDRYIREGRFNLIWFIAVPSTGENYSCAYESGFPGFSVGDGVRLIHKKEDVEDSDDDGYVIGLNYEKKGKAAEVGAVNLDDLYMDDEP